MTLPYKGRSVSRAVVNQGAAGQTDLVALVTGQRIYVVGAYIDLDAAGSLTFNSGTGPTAISGVIPIAINGGFVLPVDVDNPWNFTGVGEKLGILTATGKAQGWILYYTDR